MGIFDKIFGKTEEVEEAEELPSLHFEYKRYEFIWRDSDMERVREPIYSMVRIYKSNPSRFEVREVFKEIEFVADEYNIGRKIYLIKDLKEGLKVLLQIDKLRKPTYHYKLSFLNGGNIFTDEEAKSNIEDMSWVCPEELHYILNFAASPYRRQRFNIISPWKEEEDRKRFCKIYN